ncbi:MAG: excinuclease ABC subunit UvrB [Patescibacteria group bacterium]
MSNKLKLHSEFDPAGDQPQAIKKLTKGVRKGLSDQTLLGITGSGKTFTVSNVIENVQKPTLVVSHNKTLAAQLCNEFREAFPENAVHYFVSYYDYYQPEAYIQSTDTYIRKEAMINEEIDRLRHKATTDLLTRDDVIVVASVSCIYDLGLPTEYLENILTLEEEQEFEKDELIKTLLDMQLERTPSVLDKGKFRVRGENFQIMPTNEDVIYDIEMKRGKIKSIYKVDPVEGFIPGETPKVEKAVISPVRHYVSSEQRTQRALKSIKKELEERIKYFEDKDKYLEAERIEQRTREDIAKIREQGFCHGIENYTMHLSGREPGDTPASLLDYFPDDFLTIVDESHITIPQIRGMYAGNKSRKKHLIEGGFRLPSALENRPLKLNEFEKKVSQVIYTSATPSEYEIERSQQVVEQIIRPTGLVDPKVTIKPAKTQIKDLIPRIKERVENNERALVTTLTKKMAEDLTEYLEDEEDIEVSYLHSDIESFDRVKILTNLRKGEIDVIVGVNLLREGLDLPEVSLVAILDADQEGFLRSETTLIQTMGRAARNVNGEVLMYADKMTGSVKRAVETTRERRKQQIEYNKKHDITPQTIKKKISDITPAEQVLDLETEALPDDEKDFEKLIKEKEKEMKKAAKDLNFELATVLRDEIKALKEKQDEKEKDKN